MFGFMRKLFGVRENENKKEPVSIRMEVSFPDKTIAGKRRKNAWLKSVEDYRKSKRITKVKMAELLQVHKSTYRNWVAGKFEPTKKHKARFYNIRRNDKQISMF